MTTTGTEVQVDFPEICFDKPITTVVVHTRFLRCCHIQVAAEWSLNLESLLSNLFVLAVNLVYIIIPTIPLILLLLTVTGVCCFKMLVTR